MSDLSSEELEEAGAVAILRAGAATSPELKAGLVASVIMAVVSAVARLAVPVLAQVILDRGVLGEQGFRPTFVYVTSAAAVFSLFLLYWLIRATRLRLLAAAENTLYGLRVKVFEHVHRLSLGDHTATAKGALVTRVTSDVDALARFTEWGGVGWIVDITLILGTFAVMFIYSWQLALVAVVVFLPLLPLFRVLQRRQLYAYDLVRSRVADSASEISEQVTGAAVVRAYGVQHRGRDRMRGAIGRIYRAEIYANRYFAVSFPLGDFFGALSVSAVIVVGVLYGPGWGLQTGGMVAFLFLTSLLLAPVAEISEIMDQTQTALAGWRKILMLLAMPIEIVEPSPGRTLPAGPPDIGVEGLRFQYRTGEEVLKGIDIEIPAGTNVAVVGQTGSGKTTFAKLLVRLADPTDGSIRLSGIPLHEISAASRHSAVRMVPQDGFLFDTTVAENVQYGRPGATYDDAEQAFDALGLQWWISRLTNGLDTRVGSR
ncbi:MAG: ABC transporter ATP-binding protein, partial [Acidimicrobiales bacterium]